MNFVQELFENQQSCLDARSEEASAAVQQVSQAAASWPAEETWLARGLIPSLHGWIRNLRAEHKPLPSLSSLRREVWKYQVFGNVVPFHPGILGFRTYIFMLRILLWIKRLLPIVLGIGAILLFGYLAIRVVVEYGPVIVSFLDQLTALLEQYLTTP